MTHVYELKLTSFIDEDVEVRLITLDCPYPECPIVVHTVDSTLE